MDNQYSYHLLLTAQEQLKDYQNKLKYRILENVNETWVGIDSDGFKNQILIINNKINEINEEIEKLILILKQSQQ